MTLPPKVWHGVLRLLEAEVPEHAWRTWLLPLVARPEGSLLRLGCPSPFHRDYVRRRFLSRIDALLREAHGPGVEVALEVSTEAPDLRVEPQSGPATPPDRAETQGPPAAAPAGDSGPAAHRPPQERASSRANPASAGARAAAPPMQQSFANFVVGRCNALAREVSFAIARDDGLALSQLFIAAPPGLGKTHLCHAVVNESRLQGRRDALYTSAEAFTNEFMSSVRSNRMADFKRRYRSNRKLLVVEDVEFLRGKRQTQLEFFYTVRHVVDAGGRVVLTGDSLPREMTGLEDQVRGQLASGFVARLEPPNAQVRREILSEKAAAGGIRLPDECLDLLVDSVQGSVRDLESALIQLVTTASLLKQPIDLELARGALATRLEAGAHSGQRLKTSQVVAVVARFFETTPAALASRSRRRDVLTPRQLAMYLCHRYTNATVTEIGRAFSRRHPSVHNAIERVERDITERAPLRYQVEALIERLDDLRGGGA